MNYEAACEQLYRDRIDRKSRQEAARSRFRQSVLDRQNKTSHNVQYRTADTTEESIVVDFIMPDVLPENEDKLKWLIFQNLDLIQNNSERKKEAQQNIKKIKNFINEQKERQKLSTEGFTTS